MLNKIFKISFIIFFIIFSMSFIKIDEKSIKNPIDKIKVNIRNQENNDQIGSIIINKLNINKPLYKINSNKNNIEENITILKESIPPKEDNSILIIAAHSGTGPIAFFNELNKLEINDEIIIKYDNKEYKYFVKDIWEEKKNGYININKEPQKQLILTTCSPTKDDYQLIINCIIKES